jgi:hypothetical protein
MLRVNEYRLYAPLAKLHPFSEPIEGEGVR